MHEHADGLAVFAARAASSGHVAEAGQDSLQRRRMAGLLGVEDDLEKEFEARLTDSSTLAFRVAFAVLRHVQDAEDVAQEAFVKAFRSFRHLRDRTRFRAWLVRMTWRLAIDRRRMDRRRAVRETAHAESSRPGFAQADTTSPVDVMAANERVEQLWEAIDALPDKLRVVTVLAGIEEHDIGEVARLLRLPEGTVKSRLFHARQRLKEHLACAMTDRSKR